jgi:hypothetical protein
VGSLTDAEALAIGIASMNAETTRHATLAQFLMGIACVIGVAD